MKRMESKRSMTSKNFLFDCISSPTKITNNPDTRWDRRCSTVKVQKPKKVNSKTNGANEWTSFILEAVVVGEDPINKTSKRSENIFSQSYRIKKAKSFFIKFLGTECSFTSEKYFISHAPLKANTAISFLYLFYFSRSCCIQMRAFRKA